MARREAPRAIGLRGHQVLNPQRTEERRQGILLAAAEVFAERGYATATLDDVAERYGVTKSVIYYYFRSKEDVYVELMTSTLLDAIERIETIRAAGGPPEAVLGAVVEDSVRHVISRREHYVVVLLYQAYELSDANRERLRGLRRRYQRAFEEILEAGIAAGVFVDRSPRLTANIAIYACNSLAHWYNPDGPLPVEYVVRHTTEQVMAGILINQPAPPERRDGAARQPRPRAKEQDGA